ncbi:hypothetical protein [Ehrlichia ruminantium]|nr:hypothetical protein [Ehrlichia ruminantium]
MLFSFILRNIKNVFLKLVYFTVFFYCVSFVFIAMKDGISVAFAYKNPKNIANYAYTYLKWCYYNHNSLTYSTFFKMGVSLILPFWLYIKISKMNWRKSFNSLYRYICFLCNKSKKMDSGKELVNDNSVKDSKNVSKNYRNEMYNIKKKAMMSIEESIDRMIYETLCLKNKKINEESDKKHNNLVDGK